MWTFGVMLTHYFFKTWLLSRWTVHCDTWHVHRAGLSIPETCHQVFHPQKSHFLMWKVFLWLKYGWIEHFMVGSSQNTKLCPFGGKISKKLILILTQNSQFGPEIWSSFDIGNIMRAFLIILPISKDYQISGPNCEFLG